MSLLDVLALIVSVGGNLQTATDDAQELRFRGGAAGIAHRLAASLNLPIVLRAPVRAVKQDGHGVRIQTTRGTVTARRSIVTVSPMLTGRLRFDPPLSPQRDLYCQRQPTGASIKCTAVYDGPFWRDDGLTGFSLQDVPPVKITYDNSPPGGKPGMLVGFMEAADAIQYMHRPLADRRQATLEAFARAFGDEALHPQRYLDKAWNRDPWTRGAYGGYHPPGVLTQLGPALKRVHFAGSDTSPVWTGYMDGAIASGIRAAAEAGAAL